MKWIRTLLPIFLAIGLLLSISSIAYAEVPIADPDPSPDLEDPGDDEGDPVLDVDITVIGDNADVEIDVIGEDAEVTVNTTGTDIYLNGQNINEPTVIIRKDGDGASKGWILKRIDQAVGSIYSWAGDAQARISLTADGLAKVILTITDQDSQLSEASIKIDELRAELEAQDIRLGAHEDRLTSLDEQVEALEIKDAILQSFVEDYANYLRADYDRKLMVVVILFSVVAIGLVTGLVIVGRRHRTW